MLSIAMHKGNGYGRLCQIQSNDFTWNAAWSIYRHHPRLFKELITRIDHHMEGDMDCDEKIGKWLVGKETKPPCALNKSRLVAALLRRQNGTVEPK